MSHSSQLPLEDAVDKAFRSMGSDHKRALFVHLQDGVWKLYAEAAVSGSEKEDFDGEMRANMNLEMAQFILFRMDDGSMGFFRYVPDESSSISVKDKMLLASSSESVKRSLGSAAFSVDCTFSSPEEFSWETVVEKLSSVHISSGSGKDEEPEETKDDGKDALHEAEGEGGDFDTTPQGVRLDGLSFTIEAEVDAAMSNLMKKEGDNFLCLKLDLEKESVLLEQSVKKEFINEAMPVIWQRQEPRFYVFRLEEEDASYIRDDPSSLPMVFLYSCPESSPVKMRMVYSTLKGPILSYASKKGIEFLHKGESSQIWQDFWKELVEEHEPIQKKTELPKPSGGFSKPRRPGRGKARLT